MNTRPLHHRFLRRGFSLVELLIVVVIVGVLAMLAVPKMNTAMDERGVANARERVEAMIATARAAAIHKGRESLFITSGSWISAWTKSPTTGYWEPLVPWQQVNLLYPGVSVTVGGSGWHYVWYDKRGVAYSKPPSTTVFRITRSGNTPDSVCVTRLGQILPRSCLI
jgi:prepilin-type N-terminal cleavage/methylation domain-containing protein